MWSRVAQLRRDRLRPYQDSPTVMLLAHRPSSLLLLAAAAVMLAGAPALAQDADAGADAQGRGEGGPTQVRSQDLMADSIRHVRRANRGQVLSAESMHSDGREINRIKMVDDRGRVRVFEDDPHQRRRQRSRGDDD